MIKVCFIAGNIYSFFQQCRKLDYGGAERNFYLLGEELSKDNFYQISFVSGDFGQKNIEIIDKIRIYKALPLKKSNILLGIKNIIFYFRIFKSINADIYIESGAGIITFETALFCKIFGKKFIYRISHNRDVTCEYINNNGLFGFLFKYSLKNADIIVAQSNDQRVTLEKNLNLKSKIIRNIYKLEKKLNNFIRKDIILWVARALSWKQPEILLKLARDFPNEKFFMIMQKQDKNLWNHIWNEKDKIYNLEIIESVSPSNIFNYFKRAKIFVNTSLEEGFPNTFLQAADAKIPLLSFTVNPDNFINKHRCGFCAKGDYNKFAIYFQELIRNYNLRKEMGDNIYLYIKKYHNANKIIQSWKDIFNLCKK